MNLLTTLRPLALILAVMLVATWTASDAQAINAWGRPTYSGYPAYGYQYHNVHHHHYVYRPHYHHWHPAGWGNHGPYGGWYGGGFQTQGPGNCEGCLYHVHDQDAYAAGQGRTGAPRSLPEGTPDDVPEEPVPDLFPELPTIP